MLTAPICGRFTGIFVDNLDDLNHFSNVLNVSLQTNDFVNAYRNTNFIVSFQVKQSSAPAPAPSLTCSLQWFHTSLRLTTLTACMYIFKRKAPTCWTLRIISNCIIPENTLHPYTVAKNMAKASVNVQSSGTTHSLVTAVTNFACCTYTKSQTNGWLSL